MRTCPNCGEDNPDRARFCMACTAQLVAPVRAEARKTVSIVFTDLKGSTELGEQLDAEALREILGRYFDEMRMVLERHGGSVEKFIGDAIMAVFGLPRAHEDDALRAVRAAWEMRERLDLLNVDLERRRGVRLTSRTGVYTGEVVAGDPIAGQRLATGDAVNTAARLEQAAPPGQILVGSTTLALAGDSLEVEEVEPIVAKGKAERVAAYQLKGVRAGEAMGRRLDVTLVGREVELATLEEAATEAGRQRACTMVTILAVAGTGKTRLAAAFCDRVAERATVLRGRCRAYGQGITFWPMREVLAEAAGIADEDPAESAREKLLVLMGDGSDVLVDRLLGTMGLTPSVFPFQETSWAIREALGRLARTRILVVLLEDLHWAQGALLDLVEVTAEIAAPLMLLATARPELLELRPAWNQRFPVVRLEPLDPEEARELISALLDSTAVPAEIADQIVRASEGNPLFVEQMLAMLVDQGSIARSNGSWIAVTDLSSLPVPPTISALLAARVDRLPAEERAVLERSSVIGQVFHRAALVELLSDPIGRRVQANLDLLVGKEFIRPDLSSGEDSYRFRHALIRDAAYAGLLRRTRADLHGRLADWILRAPQPSVDSQELGAYHLEQACLNLMALGDADDHAIAMGREASDLLSAAAMRARVRGDPATSAAIMARATALRPPSDPEWLEMELDRADALWSANEVTSAGDLLDALISEAIHRSDRRLEIRGRLLRSWLHTWVSSEVDLEALEQDVRGFIEELGGFGDDKSQVMAWGLLGDLYAIAGRVDESGAAAEKTAELALAVGYLPMAMGTLGHAAKMLARGTVPVKQAIERCRALLDKAGSNRTAESRILASLAVLYAMDGELDLSRQTMQWAASIQAELATGESEELLELSGLLELIVGDAGAAEVHFRSAEAILERIAEKGLRSTVAAELARALFLQGKIEEARGYLDLADGLAAPYDVISIGVARGVRARLLARTGRFEEAVELARAAVAVLEPTDFLNEQGDVFTDLADVFACDGVTHEAARALGEAVKRYERKGNVSALRRASSALIALEETGVVE